MGEGYGSSPVVFLPVEVVDEPADLPEYDVPGWHSLYSDLLGDFGQGGLPDDLTADLTASLGSTPASSTLARLAEFLQGRARGGEEGEIVLHERIWVPLSVLAVGIVEGVLAERLTGKFSRETKTTRSIDIRLAGISLSHARTLKVSVSLEVSCTRGTASIAQLLVPLTKTVRKWRPKRGAGEWFEAATYKHEESRQLTVGSRVIEVPPGELLGQASIFGRVPVESAGGHIHKEMTTIERNTPIGVSREGLPVGLSVAYAGMASAEFVAQLEPRSAIGCLSIESPTGRVMIQP